MNDGVLSTEDGLVLDFDDRELVSQVFDKWAVTVLRVLFAAPSRFNELRRAVPAIRPKALTLTLRRLERNGIIERLAVTERLRVVNYRATELGETLRDPTRILIEWTLAHKSDVERTRGQHENAMDGRSLRR